MEYTLKLIFIGYGTSNDFPLPKCIVLYMKYVNEYVNPVSIKYTVLRKGCDVNMNFLLLMTEGGHMNE